MKTRPTVLVSGMIAADPWQGGATWALLQYVLGLRHLGYEVYLIEPVNQKSLRPSDCSLADSENADYFAYVMAQFGLSDRAAMVLAGSQQTFGLPYSRLRQIAQRADVIINVSGMLTDEALLAPVPIRVYLDLDPAFVQLWSAVQGINMRFAGHTHFVTIGQAIGERGCPVPDCGLQWLKTFQPILLERWPAARQITHDGLTTIGNWRGYGSIEHQGAFYGQKAHSLRQFFLLPNLTQEKFALALAIAPEETKDLAALASHHWELLDPSRVVRTPIRYQQFIQGSKAEFGIAKSGYVHSQCGWFSDRSVCYLASGRPVIAQETGFSRYLPTGEGLFAFSRTEQVLEAIEDVRADYWRHARNARAIAEEFFDSDKVLRRLLDLVGAPVPATTKKPHRGGAPLPIPLLQGKGGNLHSSQVLSFGHGGTGA